MEGYIQVLDNKIVVSDKSKKKKNNFKIEKINYILKKIVDKNLIYKTLIEYRKKNLKHWDKIRSHNDGIKLLLIENIEKNIFDSLNE